MYGKTGVSMHRNRTVHRKNWHIYQPTHIVCCWVLISDVSAIFLSFFVCSFFFVLMKIVSALANQTHHMLIKSSDITRLHLLKHIWHVSCLFSSRIDLLSCKLAAKWREREKKTRNERNISYLPFSQRYASNTKHKNHLILNHFVVFLYKFFLLALVIHHFGRRSCTPSKIKWVVLAIKWTFARTIHKFSTTI